MWWWSLVFALILSIIIVIYEIRCLLQTECDHLNLVFTNAAVCIVTLYFGSAIQNFYVDFLNGKSFIDAYQTNISPMNLKNYPMDEIIFWLFNTCFVLFFISVIVFFSSIKKSSEEQKI